MVVATGVGGVSGGPPVVSEMNIVGEVTVAIAGCILGVAVAALVVVDSRPKIRCDRSSDLVMCDRPRGAPAC